MEEVALLLWGFTNPTGEGSSRRVGRVSTDDVVEGEETVVGEQGMSMSLSAERDREKQIIKVRGRARNWKVFLTPRELVQWEGRSAFGVDWDLLTRVSMATCNVVTPNTASRRVTSLSLSSPLPPWPTSFKIQIERVWIKEDLLLHEWGFTPFFLFFVKSVVINSDLPSYFAFIHFYTALLQYRWREFLFSSSCNHVSSSSILITIRKIRKQLEKINKTAYMTEIY